MVLAAARPSFFRRARTRSAGWIGVDIGAGAVKLAQVEYRGDRWCLARTALIAWPEARPLTAQSVANGRLAGMIRQALDACGGFRGRDAACILSPTTNELVMLEIPAAPESELHDMICQELASHRDDAGDDLVFDYWEAHPSMATSETGAVALNVLGIRQELVELSVSELDAGRLTCHGVDGAPFTLARALHLVDDGETQTAPAAVLDWGHSSALFVVVADGQPVFSRVLRDCGCASLSQAAEIGLSLSAPEARHLLTTCGMSASVDPRSERQDLPEFVTELLRGPVDEILGELKKTLSFLKHEAPDLAPQRIWLTGGGATVRNIGRHLEAGLEVPVSNWHPAPSGAADGFAGDSHTLPVELFANAAALSLWGVLP